MTYFLHRARSRGGGPRYVARRSIQAGALAAVPEGYEFSESLGGMVSVRRVRDRACTIPMEDLELVRSALAWLPGSEGHLAQRVNDGIMIYEPDPDAYEEALRKARQDPEFSVAAHLGPTAVRAILKLRLVEDAPLIGCRRYDLIGPTHAMDLRWQVLDRDLLATLLVRHLTRRP